jgi:hypothetical protein
MVLLCWRYDHNSDIVPPSKALVFVTKMSGKRKSKSCSAFRVKNWRKKKTIEENLDLIRKFDQGEGIVDML